MMQRVYRLRRRSSFDYVYRKGKSYSDNNLVLLCLDGKLPLPKVGFVVGKKVGKAVVRNRVRRRLREIYRLHEGSIAPGKDLVVVARGRAVTATYRQLETAFLSACKKLGLFVTETSE